jgi:hypothetical protein
MPLYRTRILDGQDLHEIIRTEIEFKAKSDIYRGTNPRTEINITAPDKVTITRDVISDNEEPRNPQHRNLSDRGQ